MNENDLIGQIYSTVGRPRRWSEMIVNIADYLGATGGLLSYVGLGGRTLVVSARISDESVKIYQQHHVVNAWSLGMMDVPSDKAVILNSLLEPEQLFKSSFYAEVLAPQGIENGLATRHDALSREGGFGGFNFCLSKRGSEKAEHAIPRLQRLTAHLGQALDATMEMGPGAGAVQTLATVLNSMPNAALLLDCMGCIVHANPAAEAILAASDGLSFERSGRPQLVAVIPTERGRLSKALALTLNVATGARTQASGPVRITRLSGPGSLLVIPVSLPPPEFELWDLSHVARVLVLIVDPSFQSGSAASILRTAFGLTAAEARVAALVGKGLSGPRTAQALGLSPATVKTHLAHSFDKIGIRSQVELARLLAALPADQLPFGD